MSLDDQVIVGTHTDEDGEVYLLVRSRLTDEREDKVADHNCRQAERLVMALTPFMPMEARRLLAAATQ